MPPDDRADLNAEIFRKLYDSIEELNFEQVKDVAAGIESGELEISRLGRDEERGRIAGGRRTVEASVIAGAYQADSHGGRSTRKQNLAQNGTVESNLEKYARTEGVWLDYDDFKSNYDYLTSGQEADVFKDKNPGYVLKVVDYDCGKYGLSPLDFLDNKISLFNYLFPATKYELIGFTRDSGNRFRFILRQPLIAGETLSASKRRAYMERVLGPESEALTPEQYISPRYHIWDLHLKNLLLDKSGNVFVIDSLVELNTPDRHLGGTSEYMPFGFRARERRA